MRIVKLIAGLAVLLAFSAVAVATASAEETLWRWLPGSAKETFTGRSGKATFEINNSSKSSFTCAKSLLLLTFGTASSELLENEAKLALAILHMEKCTSGGLAFESEGDASGVILMHLEFHNCLIGTGDHGLLIRPLPLHIIFPNVPGLLMLLRGAYIALIKEETKLHYALTIEQKEGKQSIEKCAGGVKQTLEASLEGTSSFGFTEAGEEAKEFSLGFDMTLDVNGEEMMEN